MLAKSRILNDTVRYIQTHSSISPKIAMVLGSGMGNVAKIIYLKNKTIIPYADIPHFPQTTVVGHQGNLVLGLSQKQPIAIMQGRFHLYEGHAVETIIYPIQVLKELGVKILILTNAAGGLNPKNPVGSLVVIKDQINFMGKRGWNRNIIDANRNLVPKKVFDINLIQLALRAAKKENIKLGTGVYIGALGPSYETPAEIRMFRKMGGDMIGMSTVIESVAALELGMRVLGISCIANFAAGISTHALTHQEVLDISQKTSYNLAKLIKKLITAIQN